MANAGGIEHPHRAITLRSTLWRVEWVIGVPIEEAHRRPTHLLAPAHSLAPTHLLAPAHSLAPAHQSENRSVLSNAWEKQTPAARTPSADSRSIARGFARTLAHRAYEKPSDLGLVPDLHQQAPLERTRDASRQQGHQRERSRLARRWGTSVYRPSRNSMWR